MLNITKVDLEVFSDAGMCLFMEKSMGGRVYYIFKTYTVKSRINISNLVTQNKNQNISYF